MAYLLQHLLTESADHWPEKEAIRFKGQAMTYFQLDELTNQVARTLRKAGVRQGDRVGIYVHKSPASIVSVFGVLKAGGVYVPLDPNAPAKRLAYILRNCDVRVLLTSSQKEEPLSEIVAEGTDIEFVLMTDEPSGKGELELDGITVVPWSEVTAEDRLAPPDPGVIETDLAYILYTSGSTGDPKGVMISHRTIFTFINWCYDTFKMDENDRVTSHAPLHFDLSTFDIFVTIKAGATVVLIPENLSVFPVQLVKLLQDEAITVTYLVPSVLTMMVNYGQLKEHDLTNLRTVLFAGEVFPIKYLRGLVAAVPHPDYFNLYGPTETNVCTYYQVQSEDLGPERTEPVPIGVACENIEVFVVDDEGDLITTQGPEGELWVRGSCVAQGYWGDSEKTAKGFVENKFQPHFKEWAYRTGDIVILAEDGQNWRYVGRRDHMIKSRGYRIELGDIESVLYSHENVKEAVVVAVPDDMLGNRIKAFVVPIEQNGLTAKDLENYCKKLLPSYMIPETTEFRGILPKTSTGKVDRTALAADLVQPGR